MLVNTWALLCSAVFAIGWSQSTAFTASPIILQHHQQQCTTALFGSDTGYDDNSSNTNNNDLLLIREFLQANYPAFYTLLDMNEEVWKAIGDTEDGAEVGFTVFAPSAEALQALGEEKERQLFDERNMETAQKIAGYHVIGEPVTAEALFKAGGVVTASGEVPIERSISGGLFGIGGKEDGGVTLNGAKVLRTKNVGFGLVHEVDSLVSPSIVWRFMDQLRIPGST
jgi:uncharacterized surface protein with fasciclin (FAS1) repeats